ncbi:MAG: undecaprenyl/decaprenyl-phosphate alpha-N-acetylglucosaminyl 1-phosphate transferase [Proteobacteria bacterium]|nr:undecaprenyl/decaprenyl-phosphate alpha-N-acetylglucosaminyl 1-phosphate transferase [Pseudomonadota bacterium]
MLKGLLYVFAGAAACAAVLTPIVRYLATSRGWLDHALTSRKIHGRPVPRLGGVAIVGACYLALAGAKFSEGLWPITLADVPRRVWGLLAGGLAIALLGLFDDAKGANAKLKLVVQVLVACFAYWMGIRVGRLALPFVADPVQLGWFALPLTVFWIVGVMNALNLIDGLDGLAGGVALAAITVTFVLTGGHSMAGLRLVLAATAGGVVGFLIFNFHPASIFMGDTGSLFLGYMVATTSIVAQQKSSTVVALAVPAVTLALPIADTLLAMARRAARGAPIFQGDREHIHHRLLALGLSHRGAVLTLYFISVLLALSSLAIARASSVRAGVMLLVIAMVGYIALRRLGYLRHEEAGALAALRRRNLELRTKIRGVGDELRQARDLEAVWQTTKSAAEHLGVSCVALDLGTFDSRSAGDQLVLSHGSTATSGATFRARFNLLRERPGNFSLELGWSDGRREVERDLEIAVELLCDHLSAAIDRLGRSQARVSAAAPLARPVEVPIVAPTRARPIRRSGAYFPRRRVAETRSSSSTTRARPRSRS